jgi:hypothetical protein
MVQPTQPRHRDYRRIRRWPLLDRASVRCVFLQRVVEPIFMVVVGVARRQSSPCTGKCSAQPAGKPGACSLSSICDDALPRHSIPAASNTTGALGRRFQGMAESIWSDGVQKPKPGPGPYRLPPVGPRQKNAPGGARSFSSSADEFRPAIPRSGWSPPEPVSASRAAAA